MRSAILHIGLGFSALASANGSSELDGKWEQRSGSSSITYQDRTTDSFAAPTGKINR